MVVIPNTPIALDSWHPTEGVRLFFLSHMHAGDKRDGKRREREK